MLKPHALRLLPGQDLKLSLQEFAQRQNIRAGWIASCVGSLTQCNLRYANQPAGSLRKSYFEIVSLSGTVSINGCHFHAVVSDENGAVTGGHLLEGSIIYTTAETIILETVEHVFTRDYDPNTGWNELNIT